MFVKKYVKYTDKMTLLPQQGDCEPITAPIIWSEI